MGEKYCQRPADWQPLYGRGDTGDGLCVPDTTQGCLTQQKRSAATTAQPVCQAGDYL